MIETLLGVFSGLFFYFMGQLVFWLLNKTNQGETEVSEPIVGQLRGVRNVCVGEDNSETGLRWEMRLVPEEGEPAFWNGKQWVALIKGEQK